MSLSKWRSCHLPRKISSAFNDLNRLSTAGNHKTYHPDDYDQVRNILDLFNYVDNRNCGPNEVA